MDNETLEFVADVEAVFTRGDCGAEDVGVAAVLQSQALPQLLGCHREVAGSDVGLCDASKGLFQLLFFH